MQRWIVIGGLVMCLLLGGGLFGALQYRANKPDQSYLPIPFSKDASDSQKQDTVNQLKTHLLTDKILEGVSKDTGAKAYFKSSSDAEALAEVKKRAFVEVGTDKDQTNIDYSSLRVGFRGKKKEMPMLQKMAERLGKDLPRSDKPASEF